MESTARPPDRTGSEGYVPGSDGPASTRWRGREFRRAEISLGCRVTYHRASLGKAIVLRSRPAQVGLKVAATLGCRSPLSSSDDARAAVPAPTAAQKSVTDAGTSATSSTAYPIDSSPPR